MNLRNQARRAGDEAHRCFAQSQQAYQSVLLLSLVQRAVQLITRHGDGGKAHDLSAEGKRHQAEQDRLDDQASDWIFNGMAPFPANPDSV